MSTAHTAYLVHNKVRLALRRLRDGDGRALLLLHGLGEPGITVAPSWTADWPGPVHALDFTGHGESTVPVGGGYSAEVLLADADAALTHLGEATVVGKGLGAYIALMLAGARPTMVHGVVLCDGPGLSGGATGFTSHSFVPVQPSSAAPDPYALIDMSRDIRPPDYAVLFVRLALDHSPLPEPISVAAIVRPPWLAAVVNEVGVVQRGLAESLVVYGQTVR